MAANGHRPLTQGQAEAWLRESHERRCCQVCQPGIPEAPWVQVRAAGGRVRWRLADDVELRRERPVPKVRAGARAGRRAAVAVAVPRYQAQADRQGRPASWSMLAARMDAKTGCGWATDPDLAELAEVADPGRVQRGHAVGAGPAAAAPGQQGLPDHGRARREVALAPDRPGHPTGDRAR